MMAVLAVLLSAIIFAIAPLKDMAAPALKRSICPPIPVRFPAIALRNACISACAGVESAAIRNSRSIELSDMQSPPDARFAGVRPNCEQQICRRI